MRFLSLRYSADFRRSRLVFKIMIHISVITCLIVKLFTNTFHQKDWWFRLVLFRRFTENVFKIDRKEREDEQQEI